MGKYRPDLVFTEFRLIKFSFSQRAFIKYFARASTDYFDYRAFMDKVRLSADKRERNLFDDPRMGPLKASP